jgi:hypothetical protein
MLTRSTETSSKFRSDVDRFLAKADAMKAAGNRTAAITCIRVVYLLLDKRHALDCNDAAASHPSPLKSGDPIAAPSPERSTSRNYRPKFASAS